MKKVIVITGASSGFGRLSANALAKTGHTVYASMRDTDGRNAPHVEARRSSLRRTMLICGRLNSTWHHSPRPTPRSKRS
jgi:NADP-dependent 3-hydroxy acid dehydrogenase YdfG